MLTFREQSVHAENVLAEFSFTFVIFLFLLYWMFQKLCQLCLQPGFVLSEKSQFRFCEMELCTLFTKLFEALKATFQVFVMWTLAVLQGEIFFSSSVLIHILSAMSDAQGDQSTKWKEYLLLKHDSTV